MSRKRLKLLERAVRNPKLRPAARAKLAAAADATRTGAGSELQIPMRGFDSFGVRQL